MIPIYIAAATSGVLIVFGGAMIGELRAAQRVIDEQNELIKNQWIALSVLRHQQQPQSTVNNK